MVGRLLGRCAIRPPSWSRPQQAKTSAAWTPIGRRAIATGSASCRLLSDPTLLGCKSSDRDPSFAANFSSPPTPGRGTRSSACRPCVEVLRQGLRSQCLGIEADALRGLVRGDRVEQPPDQGYVQTYGRGREFLGRQATEKRSGLFEVHGTAPQPWVLREKPAPLRCAERIDRAQPADGPGQREQAEKGTGVVVPKRPAPARSRRASKPRSSRCG